MPDFVYRKGYPVFNESGKLLYVQPVRGIQAADGNWYPGVLNPDGYVYNKYPNDYARVYGNFITVDGLNFRTTSIVNFRTVDYENFMVSGGDHVSIHTGETIDSGITSIFNIKSEIEAKETTITNLINRIEVLEA